MTDSPSNSPISADTVLFGLDPTDFIVAVEPDGEEGLWVYRRLPEGVRRERETAKPWILLEDAFRVPLPGAEVTRLKGNGYQYLVEFPSQTAFQEARFRIRDAHLANLTYPAGAKMALIRSGKTLFKGMAFDDMVRLQFDLETDGLSPEPETNRILMIAVSDNRGLLTVIEGEEREILEKFVEMVRQRDPDVLEGHNIYGFDLPFVMKRAQRYGVRLAIGRDGSEPRTGVERNYAIAAGGNTRPFTPVYIHGRHVLDTYLVVQRFDWAKQALSSYGLKECARVFGFAATDRIELPRAEIARLYREDPETVRIYALQDVEETAKLAELISPVEFYQAQMVPDSYGQVMVTGNGEKINAIFVRAYLAAGHAPPLSQSSRPYAGGYAEVRLQGVIDRVVKADVESLYPSLMLTHRIAPATDTLGMFLPALGDLTRRRLEAKRKAAEGGASAQYWDGLQGSFKVLINSFYGYLGGPFYFNDFDAAARVTELGRDLVQDVASRLEATGSKVIEIDTDGVYFSPPREVKTESEEREYISQIGGALPEGIRLAFDGRFSMMLSVKTKNYVLVTYEGRKIFKGASLRSRADERFGRHFLAAAVDLLLQKDLEGIGALYERTIEDLLQRRIPIADLARRERITAKTFQSEQKRRSAVVAEGIPIGDHVLVYEKSDGSLGLLAEYANDENIRYYMDKTYKFARRLEEAFGPSFDEAIPRPTASGLPKVTQTTLDLFG